MRELRDSQTIKEGLEQPQTFQQRFRPRGSAQFRFQSFYV